MEARLSDTTNGLVRSVWEAWLVGLYFLLGGHDAAAKMARYHAWRLRQLAENWPLDEDEEDPFEELEIDLEAPRENLNLASLSLEVERALVSIEGVSLEFLPLPDDATEGRSYSVLNRSESTFGTHATVGAFMRYLADVQSEESIGVRDFVPPIEGAKDGGVAFAAMWVGHLAVFVHRAFYLDPRELEAIVDDVVAAASRASPAAAAELASVSSAELTRSS